MFPVFPLAEAAPSVDTFGFTGNQLLVWLAILFFVIGFVNQALGLMDKINASKANKPEPHSERLVTQQELNVRLTGISSKVETMRTEVLAKIDESMKAGQQRVENLRRDFHESVEEIKEKVGELRGRLT